jgi:hypothetical protein
MDPGALRPALPEVTPDRKLPTGCLVHIAGPLPGGGWPVIDVWESREGCDRFTEQKIVPAAQSLGTRQRAPGD